MKQPFKQAGHLVAILLLGSAFGCSKQPTSQQTSGYGVVNSDQPSSGYGVVNFDQPSPRWPLLRLAAPPPGVQPYLFMLFFTNPLPAGLQSTVAISDSMKYEWHKIAKDGTTSTARGVVPKNLSDALVAEWSVAAARTNLNRKLEQAVYVGPSGGPHPSQVQRLLEYISK